MPAVPALLGGDTVCMWEGEVLQAGNTPKVYRQPDTLRVAQVFSDPPLNIVGIEKKNGFVQYAGGIQAPASGLYASLADGPYRVGFRVGVAPDQPGFAGFGLDQVCGQLCPVSGGQPALLVDFRRR